METNQEFGELQKPILDEMRQELTKHYESGQHKEPERIAELQRQLESVMGATPAARAMLDLREELGHPVG